MGECLMRKMMRMLGAFTAAAVFAFLSAISTAEDLLAKSAKFSIAPQPLSSALLAFATQSGVQVATVEADLSRLQSNGVAGTRPVGEALKLLLQGTRLTFKTVGVNTITITADASQGDLNAETVGNAVANSYTALAPPRAVSLKIHEAWRLRR